MQCDPCSIFMSCKQNKKMHMYDDVIIMCSHVQKNFFLVKADPPQ